MDLYQRAQRAATVLSTLATVVFIGGGVAVATVVIKFGDLGRDWWEQVSVALHQGVPVIIASAVLAIGAWVLDLLNEIALPTGETRKRLS